MMEIPRIVFRPLDRDPSSGWVLGVCAGISAIVGVRPWILRTSLLLGLYLFPLQVVLAYAALGLLIRVKRIMLGGEVSPAGDGWHSEESGSMELYSVRDQYHDLEARLTSLESEALSNETALRRRFREAGL
jgi:phage shock protein PspC (stress-responsive transcriptional regulator)